VEVAAPATGVLREIVKGEQDEIAPGEVLGRIELKGAATAPGDALGRIGLRDAPAVDGGGVSSHDANVAARAALSSARGAATPGGDDRSSAQMPDEASAG